MVRARRLSGAWGRRDGADTFLLGAGAHLAGMSALHGYLAGSPACEPGPLREYHVLDSAGVESEAWVRDLLLDRAQASLDTARETGRASGRSLQRAAMVMDPEIYLDFFAGLLARPGIRLTMDLTPDHALLDAEQFAAVRDGFLDRVVRVVSLFVMRDPLDRLVTHLRLQQAQRPDQMPGPLETWVERLHADPAYERRTRYEHTVRALDQAFDADQVWFGFHEQLLDPDPLAALSELCRIDYREPDPTDPVARPTPTAGLPIDLARSVVAHYRDTYHFVEDRFGRDDLASIWPSARLL